MRRSGVAAARSHERLAQARLGPSADGDARHTAVLRGEVGPGRDLAAVHGRPAGRAVHAIAFDAAHDRLAACRGEPVGIGGTPLH